jgi:hypothetical protein
LVSLLAPTYNVARGEFVIRETQREIRPTRKLSGFFVFGGRKKLTVNSLKLKVKRNKKRGRALTHPSKLRVKRAQSQEHPSRLRVNRGRGEFVVGAEVKRGSGNDDYFDEVACYAGRD